VDCLTSARARIAAATDLPGVLDAAYDAFEDMLAVLRRHQEDDESAFPAYVMAAAAAANGRDWIAGAAALPPAKSRDHAHDLPERTSVTDIGRAVAALSSELSTRLTATTAVAGAGDRLSCQGAATEAAAIAVLLSGANPP
jgi:hypothetical protein